ncbi:MAG: SGNH/GDSL hydrolase family protein [Bdellovibrionota bacterium]
MSNESGSRTWVFSLTSLGLAALSLWGAEWAARRFEQGHPAAPVDFRGGFSEQSRAFLPADGNLFRTNPLKRISIVDQSFPRKKPSGAFRIEALGESSVNYLEPFLESMRGRLASKLRRPVEVINAGAKSYGSQRLAIIAQELPLYDPDLVFLYLGHNEFEEVEQFQLIRPALAPVLEFFYRSALVRVVSQFLFFRHLAELRREQEERLLLGGPDVVRAWEYSFTMKDVTERMNQFERNLDGILEIFTTRHVRIIIGTVPSNYVHPFLPPVCVGKYEPVIRAISKGSYEEANKLGHEALRDCPGRHQSSDLENAIIRRLAAKYQVELLDVERAVEAAEPHHLSGETLFADHCHLNAAGNQLLTGLLEKAIAHP